MIKRNKIIHIITAITRHNHIKIKELETRIIHNYLNPVVGSSHVRSFRSVEVSKHNNQRESYFGGDTQQIRLCTRAHARWKCHVVIMTACYFAFSECDKHLRPPAPLAMKPRSPQNSSLTHIKRVLCHPRDSRAPRGEWNLFRCTALPGISAIHIWSLH